MKIIHFQATQGSQVITPGAHVNTHMQTSICRQQNMALHIVYVLYIVIPVWQTHMTSSLHMHMFSNANGDLLWSQVSSPSLRCACCTSETRLKLMSLFACWCSCVRVCACLWWKMKVCIGPHTETYAWCIMSKTSAFLIF